MSFGAGLERLIILALSSNRFGRFYKFKYIYAARMFISEKNQHKNVELYSFSVGIQLREHKTARPPAFTGRSSDFATVAPWKPRYFLISQQKILKAQRARSQKKIFLSSVTDCQISLNNSRIRIWYTIRDAPRAKHIQKLATRIPIILGPITNRIHDLFFSSWTITILQGLEPTLFFFIYGKTRPQTTCARSREYRSINN